MNVFVEMISFPFMQRAFLAGMILGLLLACLGVYVTLRRMAFFGDGIAHASLAGIAIALLAGIAPLPTALAWALFIAIFIERKVRISSDSLIGILFTASMALGVILMRFTQGYQPDLVSYLFGSILSIQTVDLFVIFLVTAGILAWIAISFRSLTSMSLSEEQASVNGVNTTLQSLLLYIALALATVLGVKILGIILVSALLILPSATSRLLTRSFKSFFFVSILLAETAILVGLTSSYFLDLPSGAAVILVGTILFFLAIFFRKK
jgi:zinc transport system permease protein